MKKTLDIPFISSRGFECGQTCAAMMIKHFYPSFEPDFNEFNKIIHHVPGKYTFPLQNALLLDYYGVKAKCFSSDDYKTTIQEPGIFKRWYGKECESQMKYIDIDSFNWMVSEALKKRLFKKTVTTVNQMIQMFNRGFLVALILDWNTLSGKSGEYLGHSMLLSGVDGDTLLLHDPDIGPFQPYSKSQVEKAFSHPLIAHDLLVAYGKK